MNTCDICRILPNIPGYAIIDDHKDWLVNLAFQDQSNLGRCYIALKRHASELDELTEQEEASFRTVRNALIKTLRAEFNPLTFNISCLKNDAFKQNPDTTPSSAAHVHWHVIPRYGTTPLVYCDDTFYDPSPGRYLELSRERKTLSQNSLEHIAHAIKRGYNY
jgi:diadenosine tetraphosphate (Ap4A) HIT family hydrolase